MRVINILLSIISLATTASAFFPWYPDYRCAKTHDCVVAKNSDEGQIVGRGHGLTVKVIQRVPENDESPIAQIRHLADQLRSKYLRGSLSKEEDAHGHVVERANTYSIMQAATPTQATSAGINQDGTDYSYFAQVQLGSANTPLYMLLDTGADSSWVMGSACSSGPCMIHNLYNPTTSTTYKALGQSFAVQYGSGSVSGTIGTDDLTLAGLQIPISLGIVNVTSNDFNNFPMEGILGLSLGKSSYPSFLDSLKASGALKSNIFGMSLNRASDGPNTGEINFGALDTSKYSGDISYTAVSSAGGGFWAIPMANVGLGSSQAGITTKLAYIDTGTSFIFCSPDDAKIFHAVVPGATTTDNVTWHVPCSTTASVVFTFGSKAFSVLPKDWMSPPLNGVCTSNIYGHDIVGGGWLLGDTFIKNVYAVFDADQSRVGFAQKLAVVASSSTTAATSAPTPTGMPSSIAGSSSTIQSNGPPPGTVTSGSATFTASTLASVTSSGTTPTVSEASPGLNGHETSNSNSGTAAAQSTSVEASPTSTTSTKNAGLRLQSSLSVASLGLLLTLFT